MTCPNCGRNIASDSNFCEFCGAKIPRPKNRKALWITLVVIFVVVFMAIVSYRAYVVHEKAVAEARAAQEDAERQITEAKRLAEEARLAQEEADRKAKEAAAEALRMDSIRHIEDEKRWREQEAENARRKAIADKKRAEERRRASLRERGLVDLGLPSGTLWRKEDENNGLFYFNSAFSKYKNCQIPQALDHHLYNRYYMYHQCYKPHTA